jgi:hypothetical protein
MAQKFGFICSFVQEAPTKLEIKDYSMAAIFVHVLHGWKITITHAVYTKLHFERPVYAC